MKISINSIGNTLLIGTVATIIYLFVFQSTGYIAHPVF